MLYRENNDRPGVLSSATTPTNKSSQDSRNCSWIGQSVLTGSRPHLHDPGDPAPSRSQPHEEVLPSGGRYEFFQLYSSINYKGKAVDPFDSSSIQITQNVHHLLTYFEKPFLTQIVVAPLPSPRLDSACSQVIRDCVFDETNYSSWSSAESAFRASRFQRAILPLKNLLRK
jgi:hypothetical protein